MFRLLSLLSLFSNFRRYSQISGGILASSSIWTEQLLRFIPGRVDALMICQVSWYVIIKTLLSIFLKSENMLIESNVFTALFT